MTTEPQSPAAADAGGRPLPAPVAWLSRLRGRGAAGDRRLLAVAAVVFIVVFVVSLRDLPTEDLELRWWALLALTFVGVPLQVLANAGEYVVTGRVHRHRVGFWAAAEVSVLSSAANLLPIPGAALVKVRALRRVGWSSPQALGATALVGGAWLATTFVAAGVLLLVAGETGDGGARLLGAAMAAGGVVASVVVALLLGRSAGRGRRLHVNAMVFAVEAVAVVTGSLRFVLAFQAIGVSLTVAQAVALTVTLVVSSAIGFLPGGLGLRELLAGAISPVIGLPAAVGLFGVAIDRLVGLVVLGAFAVALARRGTGEGALQPQSSLDGSSS